MRRFEWRWMGPPAFLLLLGVGPVGSLQNWVVDQVADRATRNTPYLFSVGGVEGNLLKEFSLVNVQLRARDQNENFVEAKRVRMALRWKALLQKRLEIDRLVVEEPIVRLTWSKEHRWVVPVSPPSKKSPAALPLEIPSLIIKSGQVRMRSEATNPVSRITVARVDANAQLVDHQLEIRTIAAAVEAGTLVGSGKVRWGEHWKTILQLTTQAFPLEQLVCFSVLPPDLLRLTQTGRWDVLLDPRNIRVRSQGRLVDVPMTLAYDRPQGGTAKLQLSLDAAPVRALWRDPRLSAVGNLSINLSAIFPKGLPKEADIQGVVLLRRRGVSGLGQVVSSRLDIQRGRGPMVVSIRSDGIAADATAQVDIAAQTIESDFALQVSSFMGVAEWIPAARELEGHVEAQGSVRGPWNDLAVHANARASDLWWGNRVVDRLELTIKGGTGPSKVLQIEAQADEVGIAESESMWDVEKLTLALVRKVPRWDIQADAHFRNRSHGIYKGNVSVGKSGWTSTWETVGLDAEKGPSLRSQRPGSMGRTAKGVFEIQDLSLASGSGQIQARARLDSRSMAVDLISSRWPLGAWLPLLTPARRGDFDFDGEVHLSGARREPSGTVSIRLSSGSLQGWAFREVALKARSEPPFITVEELQIYPTVLGHDVHGAGRIPWRWVEPLAEDVPVHFRLQAPSVDPSLLTALVPTVTVDKAGVARLDIAVSGKLPDVDVHGALEARFPRLAIEKAGLNLTDVVLLAESTGRTLTVRQGTAKSKKGSLSVSGTMRLPDLKMDLVAQNLDINIPKRLTGKVNAQLALAGDLEGPDVSGEIRIRDATYTVPKKEKRKAEASDVVETEKRESPMWEGTTLNIHSVWPRGVWYREGLTKIETSGDLQVLKDEGTDELYLQGQIRIVRGTYDAYGRDFLLDSGDLVFTGPPTINPILNLRAKYPTGGTEVSLDVKGTAKEPLLTLSSNPPLPEQDIVSVLVVGKPLNQIGPTDPNGTSRAAQAAALAGNVIGGYITRELRESSMDLLSLDVVRVDPTTQGSRLTIGRYIGDKLFVSYGQPLQSSVGRVFNADYYLNRRWTVAAQTGSGAQTGTSSTDADTHVDLEFRYPLNGTDRARRNTAPMPGLTSTVP